MTIRAAIMKIVLQDDLNFLLTNALPRRSLTRFTGWFSKIEQPLIRDLSLRVWRYFGDLDLSDARRTDFRSLHDCFTRQLKEGARPVDEAPDVITSPCDAIIGAIGRVENGQVLQVKGFSYALEDLLGDPAHAERFRDGLYVTLRLTSSMYHRFHAPYDCTVDSVSHFPGDVWNVNPPTLKRIRRLYCRNERAVISTRLTRGDLPMTLVAVAAVLVAGIRLRFLDISLRAPGQVRRTCPCDAALRKGEEMGWFEHGSTIILFAPSEMKFDDRVRSGAMIRTGEALIRAPADH